MKQTLSVVMVAAEAHPLAKVGGLADVMGALPRALANLGHSVTIILPYYGMIKEKKWPAVLLKGVGEFPIDTGTSRPARVWRSSLSEGSVSVLLVENDDLFGRKGIYTNPASGKDYADNAERFVFFSKAVVKVLELGGARADIIHCHDSQTGFVPAWVRMADPDSRGLGGAGTVFTIHNLAYQGVYPMSVGRMAGFGDDAIRPMGPVEFYGGVNMMKAGIVSADLVTTVSPTYAQEIQTPEFGYGLEGVLKSRAGDLEGVLNGVDYSVWNPATDGLLPCKYDSRDLGGKRACREHLIRRLGLRAEGSCPLVGMVSRLVDQKGLDITMPALDAMMGLGMTLVVLGVGDHKYHDGLKAYAQRFPGRVSVNLAFDEGLAHLIEAGCDMFLMPSKYEPCGLNQMYSMKYGTVPIVRRTGGLADTVVDHDGRSDSTGFVFGEYAPRALTQALERARDAYSDRETWNALVLRAMAQDFSWDRSASAYQRHYTRILSRQRTVT